MTSYLFMVEETRRPHSFPMLVAISSLASRKNRRNARTSVTSVVYRVVHVFESLSTGNWSRSIAIYGGRCAKNLSEHCSYIFKRSEY